MVNFVKSIYTEIQLETLKYSLELQNIKQDLFSSVSSQDTSAEDPVTLEHLYIHDRQYLIYY